MLENMRKITGMIAGLLLAIPVHAAVNDECANAVVLVPASPCAPTNGDLGDATESLPAVECMGYTSASARDLWYSFTAADAYTRLRALGGIDLDLVIEVFTGNCGALASADCADATFVGGVEELNLATTIGTTYFVRVYAWEYATPPTDQGFSICAMPGLAPPANDKCADVAPQPLMVGGALDLSGTTSGATDADDNDTTSLISGFGPFVWHAFTLSECARVTVGFCGTSPVFGNVLLALSPHCPADSTVLFADSWDQTSCGNSNVTFTFDSLGGGTYYLPVVLDDLEANGPYLLHLSASACATSVGDLEDRTGWRVFPVPNEGDFTIAFSDPASAGTLNLVDALGRTVWTAERARQGGGTIEVDLKDRLRPGAYLLRFVTSGGVTVARILVR